MGNTCTPMAYSCQCMAKTLHYCKMLLLLSHFSRARLHATPETAAHQPPPSLGFSRQEHWSTFQLQKRKEKVSLGEEMSSVGNIISYILISLSVDRW